MPDSNTFESYEEIEKFLQINLYCSEEQLQCWNVSQFLEGLGVIKAVFFIVSSRADSCYEECECVSHLKNVEAQLNIYDLSLDSYQNQGIDISRVLSSIGIHHVMKEIPIVKTNQLIIDLKHERTSFGSAESVAGEHKQAESRSHMGFRGTNVQKPMVRFRTSTPISDSPPRMELTMKDQNILSCDSMSKYLPDLVSLQPTEYQNVLDTMSQLSPDDRLEVQLCCKDMLDKLSAQEMVPSRSLDDLNLSGFFSFDNSLSISSGKNLQVNNSLLQMTGFSSILNDLTPGLDGKRSTSYKRNPKVIRKSKRFQDLTANDSSSKRSRLEDRTLRENVPNESMNSSVLVEDTDFLEENLRPSSQKHVRANRHSYNFNRRFQELTEQNQTPVTESSSRDPPNTRESIHNSNEADASYDEVFIRRRVSRGKTVEIRGKRQVVTQCNHMGCNHVVTCTREQLKNALLDHVQEHLDKAEPCPTVNCPDTEKTFLDIRHHLRVFHELDWNCIEALLKRSNRRRMRIICVKCFPNKFF